MRLTTESYEYMAIKPSKFRVAPHHPGFLTGMLFATKCRAIGFLAAWGLLLPIAGFAQFLSPGCTQADASSSANCSQIVDSSTQTIPVRPAATLDPRNSDSQQPYVDSAGISPNRSDRRPPVPDVFPADPITDFQQLAKLSTSELLPIFGRDFFERAPSTFAPSDQISGLSDYLLGPGDEILLRLWGPESSNSRLTVDPSGAIYIPKVGAVHVAGLRYDQLETALGTEIDRIYKNYRFSVSLGQLRSIQVYVVGEARRPGAYTISSLSTILNALFVSGGPNVQGSLRHIQVRRGSEALPEFDLYDLVLRGNKSKDVRLQTGDTIFIPAVGPQVAIGGSVRHPAIYELDRETSVEDLLQLAGGFSATAFKGQLRIERIDADRERKAMTLALDPAGRGMVLRDGDILYANHISAGYEKSVTIRGNLANPGRFAWHEGMRLSDVIPDRLSLLTNDYWRNRDRLGVPVPLFEPMTMSENARSSAPRSTNELNPAPSSSGPSVGTIARTPRQSSKPEFEIGETPVDASSQVGALNSAGVVPQQDLKPSEPAIGNEISIPAAEIDWSYAVIERLDQDTLKSSLVPFNLGKLVLDNDPSQNLELKPGDVVTILSQNDVLTPQDTQTKYVRLEGEFISSGVYSVGPNETLDLLVQRAGGLTAKAYLYGSSFSRESARIFQQQRLNEYISSLSADMDRASAVRAASSPTGVLDPNALAEQRTLVAQLRLLRATGRVVLEFRPDSADIASIPKIPLENGDVFRIPTTPNTVSVVGAVYGQNVFLYTPTRKLEDYVALAGNPNRIADIKRTFIIRADGSIYSRDRAQHLLSNDLESTRIHPGDAIVIPEKLIKPNSMKTLLDYSQILASFGLAAAAINVIK